jgi:diguanylate cyclase (GGDEF)-like protein/PAS domain S-box-containing protein
VTQPQDSPDIPLRERLPLYLIPGLATLLIVTLFALAFYTLAKSRETHLREAGRTTQNLAQVLEEQTSRTLQAMDITLVGLADMMQRLPGLREPSSPAMQALLREKLASLPFARELFVLDARGWIIHDAASLPPGVQDLSDRPYFTWPRTHRDQLYIGKPTGIRAEGEKFVAVARRLDDGSSGFAGVIVAALDPRAFQSFYKRLDIGRDGAISLLHEGGELVARVPEAAEWLGMPTGNSLTRADLAARGGSRTFRASSPVDSVPRLYSARLVGDSPFMVEVGLSEERILAGWREDKTFTVIVLVGFTLATIILAWLLLQELQRRSEMAGSIVRSERLLRQVLDTLPVGVWVADRDGRPILGNAANRKIFAGMAQDAQPQAWSAVTGKPLVAAEWGLGRALQRGESTRNDVIDVDCGGGTRKTVLNSAAPIVSPDGEIVGAISVNEDITDRRVLAESLRESEARYRALFQHSIDAIFLSRPDGTILAANEEACRLLGYTEAELLGLGRDGVVDTEDPRLPAALEERRRTGSARGELRMRRKDGTWFPAEFSSATFRDGAGELCASLIVRDVTERKRAEEHIEFLAYHDELTGIPNRAWFQRAVEHAFATNERYGLNCALMMVDLDRFKNINDTIGHEAGDQLLKQVAARLHSCLRESDIIARLGGDEFVILMQDASSLEAVNAVADKILEATSRPLFIEDQEFLITASIGISTYPHDGTDLQSLLRNSDVAMYRAKEAGKNGYQYFSPEMNVRGRDRLSIESALRRALERGEFAVHFQPKVRVDTREVAGVEALVRWHNPEKGMVHPAEFIGIAEETGLIVPIGDWVLEEACSQGESLRLAGYPDIRVAVNISMRQLSDRAFPHRLSDILAQTGFPAHNLELELTESMVMRDAENAVTMLESVRSTGVRLAIDDFGTGYSSLAYLKRLPIDCVKIDRSFIRDLPEDRDDVSITRSIIAMAHNMKLEVVAEGVETVAQFDFLNAHGCDEIQGFLFSVPLPMDELKRFLHAPAGPMRPSRASA